MTHFHAATFHGGLWATMCLVSGPIPPTWCTSGPFRNLAKGSPCKQYLHGLPTGTVASLIGWARRVLLYAYGLCHCTCCLQWAVEDIHIAVVGWHTLRWQTYQGCSSTRLHCWTAAKQAERGYYTPCHGKVHQKQLPCTKRITRHG